MFLALATVPAVSCVPASADSPTAAAKQDSSLSPAGLRYEDEVFTDVTVEKNIEYGTAPALGDQRETALKLDLYQPKDDPAPLRPAIIWVHGGGFAAGDKSDRLPALMSSQFAKLGYVALAINYRLLDGPQCNASKGVGATCFNAGVEAVRDAQTAVRWLRANAVEYRIDVDRIAIAGESAGGIVATGVGVASDLAAEDNSISSAVHAWVSISGGLPGGIFVDATDPAGLLFAGTKDTIVPYAWSVETAAAMDAAGVTAVLASLQDAGHVPWADYGEQIMQESRDFLYDRLTLQDAAR